MLTPTSFGESQDDPDLAHRKPTLREWVSSAAVVVAGSIAIPVLLGWAIAIEWGEQVRQWATGRRDL